MTPTFASYSSIDWSEDDLAPRLDDLRTVAASKSTPATVKRALRRIETAIYDQGCAGPITTKTVPLLVEALSGSPSPAAKEGTLALLADILTDDADFVFERFSLRGPLVAAIRRGQRRYAALLEDRDARVRAQAARILAYHPGTGATLAARCVGEKDARTLATLVLAIAMQKKKPPVATSKSAVVGVASVLGALIVRRKLDDAGTDVLLAALKNASLDRDFPFFHGRVRAAAMGALGRFGRGNAKVIDALVALRASTARIASEPDDVALGTLAVVALAEIAVPKRGKLDAAGRDIVKRILDVNPGWALAHHGLPADPVDVARLLGQSLPERPSRLQDALGKSTVREAVLELVLDESPYDPRALLARLMKLERDARLDVVLDLLPGRDKMSDVWTYGRVKHKGRLRPGEENTIATRRRARVCDLCYRLLCDTGPALVPRIDAELAALERGAAAARGALQQVEMDRRYLVPGAFLALFRARFHLDAGEPLPPSFAESLRRAAFWVFAVPYVRPLLAALGDDFVARLNGMLWWYAEEPIALRALVKWAKAERNKEWVTPPSHELVTHLAATLDPESLDPVMREAVKAKHGYGADFQWTSPRGDVLVIHTHSRSSELDQVFRP